MDIRGPAIAPGRTTNLRQSAKSVDYSHYLGIAKIEVLANYFTAAYKLNNLDYWPSWEDGARSNYFCNHTRYVPVDFRRTTTANQLSHDIQQIAYRQ